jgi:flagellar hook-basal body complex protein FliE
MKIDLTSNPIVVPGLTAPGLASVTPPSGSNGFSGALEKAVADVESSQQAADSAAMDFLTAGTGDVHNVALASQRADLTLEMFQQVRNKFVQAYQEIMKTPM